MDLLIYINLSFNGVVTYQACFARTQCHNGRTLLLQGVLIKILFSELNLS